MSKTKEKPQTPERSLRQALKARYGHADGQDLIDRLFALGEQNRRRPKRAR